MSAGIHEIGAQPDTLGFLELGEDGLIVSVSHLAWPGSSAGLRPTEV